MIQSLEMYVVYMRCKNSLSLKVKYANFFSLRKTGIFKGPNLQNNVPFRETKFDPFHCQKILFMIAIPDRS